jgi:hypothetical protein
MFFGYGFAIEFYKPAIQTRIDISINDQSCGALHTMISWMHQPVLSGSSSAVERQLPKLDVTGSIPVSRSILSISLNS